MANPFGLLTGREQYGTQANPGYARPIPGGWTYDLARAVQTPGAFPGQPLANMLFGNLANLHEKRMTGQPTNYADYVVGGLDVLPPGIDDVALNALKGFGAAPLAIGMTRGTEAGNLFELMKQGKPREVSDEIADAMERRARAEQVLAQPIEWEPPPSRDWLLDRGLIREAAEGHPGVEQKALERMPRGQTMDPTPVMIPWSDPENVDLIKRQVERGRGAGGEMWYQSTYPIRAAYEELDTPITFDDFVWANAFTSPQARVSVNVPTASALLTLQRRGEPMTVGNLRALAQEIKDKYQHNLKAGYFTSGDEMARYAKSRELGLPENFGYSGSEKIAAYGEGLRGNIYGGVPLDTHEMAGTTYGTRLYPYFEGENTIRPGWYGPYEKTYKTVLQNMGLAPTSGQASRWIGGGELTGLKTGPGDFLSITEDLARWNAYIKHGDASKEAARKELFKALKGEEPLIPYHGEGRIKIPR